MVSLVKAVTLETAQDPHTVRAAARVNKADALCIRVEDEVLCTVQLPEE